MHIQSISSKLHFKPIQHTKKLHTRIQYITNFNNNHALPIFILIHYHSCHKILYNKMHLLIPYPHLSNPNPTNHQPINHIMQIQNNTTPIHHICLINVQQINTLPSFIILFILAYIYNFITFIISSTMRTQHSFPLILSINNHNLYNSLIQPFIPYNIIYFTHALSSPNLSNHNTSLIKPSITSTITQQTSIPSS